MSDEEDNGNVELPQIWQYIHPMNNEVDSEEDEEEGEDVVKKPFHGERPADYVKLSKRAPRIGQLIRFLNDIEEDEELQQLLLEKDPVTQQSLLQWAAVNGHFALTEYLIKRLRRGAFAFDPESVDVAVFMRWEEMKPELPSAAEVAEKQKQKEEEKAERAAQRRNADEEEEEEEEEPEPTPEELVYESLEEFHDEWGENGLGIVKRIGELGVYSGSRLRDGTKQGIGQSLFPNGDCYAGEYMENQRNGVGVYWWANSSIIYCGQWLRNMRHGYGRAIYPDGSRYLGYWANDMKHGRGRYTYPNGSSYDGMWSNNEKHGSGESNFPDGSSLFGSFHHNDFISGEWRLASGTVRYIGNFANNSPAGAGIFIHRSRSNKSVFQVDGTFREGRWHPNIIKTSAAITHRLEIIAPQQELKRVPIQFGADCNGRTMSDLVKAANFTPLVNWVLSLPSIAADRIRGVELRSLDVSSIKCHPDDPHRVTEVRVKPLLVDAEGRRIRILGDEVLLLKNPTVRLMVIIQQSKDAEPVLVLEHSLQFISPDDGHMQYRIPVVRMLPDGTVDGEFVKAMKSALRLDINEKTIKRLIHPLRSNSFSSNGTEEVMMYSQELHADAFASLEKKLRAVSLRRDVTSFVALPLSEVLAKSSDGVTIIAASTLSLRRENQTLPESTVEPQRPPTPLPPPIEPRPELQPLYVAKANRDRMEAEAEEE